MRVTFIVNDDHLFGRKEKKKIFESLLSNDDTLLVGYFNDDTIIN